MTKLWKILARRSVEQLTRIAAMLALVGLAIMVSAILFPHPLPVILAMSVGHVVGGAAFVCYLLAVLLDVSRSDPTTNSIASRPNSTRREENL